MDVFMLVLFILAGVFFGLAAGRVAFKYDLLALGLLCFAIAEIAQRVIKL